MVGIATTIRELAELSHPPQLNAELSPHRIRVLVYRKVVKISFSRHNGRKGSPSDDEAEVCGCFGCECFWLVWEENSFAASGWGRSRRWIPS